MKNKKNQDFTTQHIILAKIIIRIKTVLIWRETELYALNLMILFFN